MKEWREQVINDLIQRGGGAGMSEQMLDRLSFHLSVQLRINLNDARAILNTRLKPIEAQASLERIARAEEQSDRARQHLNESREIHRQATINASSYARFLELSEEQYVAQAPLLCPDFPGIGRPIADSPYSLRRLLSEGTRISWKDQASLSGIEIDPEAEALLDAPRGTEFRIPSKPFTSWVGVMEWRDIVEGPDKAKLDANYRWATVLENIAFSRAYPDAFTQVGGQLAIGGFSKNNLTPYLDGRRPPVTLSVYDSSSLMQVYPALAATKSVRS